MIGIHAYPAKILAYSAVKQPSGVTLRFGHEGSSTTTTLQSKRIITPDPEKSALTHVRYYTKSAYQLIQNILFVDAKTLEQPDKPPSSPNVTLEKQKRLLTECIRQKLDIPTHYEWGKAGLKYFWKLFRGKANAHSDNPIMALKKRFHTGQSHQLFVCIQAKTELAKHILNYDEAKLESLKVELETLFAKSLGPVSPDVEIHVTIHKPLNDGIEVDHTRIENPVLHFQFFKADNEYPSFSLPQFFQSTVLNPLAARVDDQQPVRRSHIK